jgi:antitoxin ParD1/3/4
MSTMNLDLPEPISEFVQQQVAQGGFNDAGEYLRQLILADRRRKELAALETEIIKGLDSGESTPMTAADWAEIREDLRGRQAGANKS